VTDRMTEADWQRVTLYAAPRAIEARLETARRALAAAQRTVDRWEALRALRASQVEAGTWPESARQAKAAEEEATRQAWDALLGRRGIIDA
jgi:hypothetical protein